MDKPQKYIRKPQEVQVMKFKGGYDSALAITHWVTDLNEQTRYIPGTPERLVIIDDYGMSEVQPGGYVVFSEETKFRTYTTPEFKQFFTKD